jgi:hypothetical protein
MFRLYSRVNRGLRWQEDSPIPASLAANRVGATFGGRSTPRCLELTELRALKTPIKPAGAEKPGMSSSLGVCSSVTE